MRRRNMCLLTGWVCLTGLVGCGPSESSNVVTMSVTREPFEIAVSADGRLRAVKATPITAPRSQTGANTISWLLPEGTFVKEGDVLVRFDEASLKVKEGESTTDLATLDYRIHIDGRNHGQEDASLAGQIFVLREERDQSAQFAPKDEKLYTRNEIIESQVNLEFLDTKVDHYSEKKDRHELRGKTQSEIHELTKKNREMQLNQVRDSLNNLITRAPHDGYFFYERNWRGEATRVGELAWSGMKLGELPDLNNLEAQVYVLEKEASGLKAGLKAEVTLDARPGIPYEATIKSVATLAKAVDRNSPINYFEVVLSLETTDLDFMRPGGLVRARIFIDRRDDAIALPNQVFYHGEGENWVYVRKGEGFEKRLVTLGKRGPNRTVVEDGLQAGDEVAMSDPNREETP